MSDAPAAFERIAHRGSPRERLENTLPGFAAALEHGADAIELDVHVSSDGVAVVHHDPVVGAHEIAHTPWRELAVLRLADGERIPRLQDVLEAVGGRATMYIEIKSARGEEEIIDTARQYGQRFAMHSFDFGVMARVARRAPGIARGALLDRGAADVMKELRRAVDRVLPRDIWPHWTLVTPELVAAATEVGARVIAWTVNSADDARALVDMGVQGICTDDVRLLVNL